MSRRRQEITMPSGTKLYLDKVEGVNGYFAKMEAALSDNDKVSEVRAEMVDTFRALGEEDVQPEGYYEMV